jgi:hypothetical protein
VVTHVATTVDFCHNFAVQEAAPFDLSPKEFLAALAVPALSCALTILPTFIPLKAVARVSFTLMLIIGLGGIILFALLKTGRLKAPPYLHNPIVLLWPFGANAFVNFFITLEFLHYALNWTRLLAPAAVIAVAIFSLLLKVNLEFRRLRMAWILAILTFSYSLSMAMILDLYYDPTPVKIYETIVLDRHSEVKDSGGEMSAFYTEYRLTLAPWGPVQQQDSMIVSERTFGKVANGQKISIRYTPGLFGTGWKSLAPTS